MKHDSPTFSIISVYNDPNILSAWLKEGIHSQSYESVQCIFIDNTDDQYSTAAEALNAGAEQATGEFFVFVHQDVRLLTQSWFEAAEQYLRELPDCGIAGIFGKSQIGKPTNIIYHGRPTEEFEVSRPSSIPSPMEFPYPTDSDVLRSPERAKTLPSEDIVHPIGYEITSPTPVQTLDELLTIIPASVFDNEKFDPDLCDGWHLYAIEYCLRIKYKTELEVYALPLPAWHRSTGLPLDASFYRILSKVVDEYKSCSDIEYIHAPTGRWPLRPWLIDIQEKMPNYQIIHRTGQLKWVIQNPSKALKIAPGKFLKRV